MKRKKDKKRDSGFYDNKNRDQKWTETPTGRQIDFADKYIYDGNYSDKYAATKRPAYDDKAKAKAQKKKKINTIISIIMAVVLICVGYIGTDVYMTRHAEPAESIAENDANDNADMSDLSLNIMSSKVEPVSLDNSVMLDSVISNIQDNGCNSITFDAKRSDGTIGYASSLASIDTFGAISNNSTATKQSVQKLSENDILTVARISCYKDNVVPSQSADMALKQGDKYYTDKDNNTYLNPNSDETYSYIKDIIQELYSYGITVFVLTDYDLPTDISSSYNDGFDTIAAKLTKDLDNKVKIVQETDISLTGKDDESGKITNSALTKEIKQFKKLKSNQIYYINTDIDSKRVLEQLTQNNVTNFILKYQRSKSYEKNNKVCRSDIGNDNGIGTTYRYGTGAGNNRSSYRYRSIIQQRKNKRKIFAYKIKIYNNSEQS